MMFLPFCIPLMVVMYQIAKTMHHVCVYLSVKVDTLMSLKQSKFCEVENSTPLMGLEPTISRLHTEFD